MRRHAKNPVRITDAPENPAVELRRREIRYLIMMSARAVCLIVAAVLVSLRPPLLGLWLALCVAGMVLLPWLAVILANDRPPRTRSERESRPMGSGPAAIGPPRHPRVIDENPSTASTDGP
ncbi:MAG: DUF3099 domain-containing protein [Micromonosporaceae bacterium]